MVMFLLAFVHNSVGFRHGGGCPMVRLGSSISIVFARTSFCFKTWSSRNAISTGEEDICFVIKTWEFELGCYVTNCQLNLSSKYLVGQRFH